MGRQTMFERPGKTRSKIRTGTALALAALCGLASVSAAGADTLPMPFRTTQPAVGLALHGLASADILRDAVLRLPAANGAGIDMAIRTASTLRGNAPAAPARTARSRDVFGSVAIAFRRLPALAKIAPAQDEMTRAGVMRCADDGCTLPRRRMMESLGGLRNAPLAEKAKAVNTQVNAHVAYRRDAENYGVVDYWATPQEILARRAGDCEDYAILKMALLREIGVAERDMAIVVLRDESRGLFHAVLSLRTGAGYLILDNMRDEVLADGALPHYLPLYSVSAGRGFIHGRKSGSSPVQVSGIPFDMVAPGEGPDPDAAGAPHPGI